MSQINERRESHFKKREGEQRHRQHADNNDCDTKEKLATHRLDRSE
ncbi:hypothetical protein [Bradyrhizobium rifense]|nr:hypothetical protein [Bradyrhizobium rifense]